MFAAFCLSPVILASHSKVSAGKGQHPEVTLLSSGAIPALFCYPQLRNQADPSGQAHLSDCTSSHPPPTAPGVKRAPWRSNGGSQAPREILRLVLTKFSPSRSFLSLHLAETKWNSHLYLPAIHCIAFFARSVTSVDIG